MFDLFCNPLLDTAYQQAIFGSVSNDVNANHNLGYYIINHANKAYIPNSNNEPSINNPMIILIDSETGNALSVSSYNTNYLYDYYY